MFLKKVSFAHQGCIYLLKNAVKTAIFWKRQLSIWIYTARPQKSHHLDLTKQKGNSLPLDNYCMDDYVSAGNKLFNHNWCSE